MNAAITGQIVPDSVILWLLVVLTGLAVWAHAAPRPIGAIMRDAAGLACDAVRNLIARFNVRTMP